MATLTDVIRRITISGKTDGVTQATSELNSLSVAQESAGKSSLSMATKIESLQKSLDAEYRAEKQLEAAQKTLTAARAQGLITVQRQNELATLAAAKYRTEGEAATKAAEGLKMLKEASLGFASGLGAGVLFGGITELPTAIAEAVEKLGNTANVAQTIGITTQALQQLRYAAQLSDVDVGTLDEAMQKFSTNLAKPGSPLEKLLAINNVKISGDVLTDLEHFADLVKNASNQEERNAIITTAFGKSAQEMGRLFEDGGAGIAKWADEAQRAGAVHSDEEILRAREYGDAMKRLTPELQAAQQEFALLVVPGEIALLQSFNVALGETRDILTAIHNLDFGSLLSRLGDLGNAVAAGPGGFFPMLQAERAARDAQNAPAKITVDYASSGNQSTRLPAAGTGADPEKSYEKLIESTDKRIFQLGQEKDALTATGLAADTMRGFADLLNQAEATGVKLGPDRIAQLYKEADALAKAQEALEGGKLNQQDATPFDTFGAQMGKLNGMLKDGAISWQTYSIEVAKSADTMANKYGAAANVVLDSLDQISSAIGTAGREQFELHKALAIARAVVSGGEAVVHAYAAGTATGGGPIVGAIFAGIAAAATAAQIAAIASTSYTSTSVASPAASGSSASSAAAAAVAPTTTVYLQGNYFTGQQVADLLTQLIKDNGGQSLVNVLRAA